MRAITTTTRRARALGGVALVVALLAVSACSDSNDASTAPTDTTVDRGEVFVGVTPVRVLDTRQEGSAKFTEGETRTLSFADQVPDTATSVALAIVAPSGATALGYFTMWPSGEARPNTSVLNPATPYDLATSVLLRLGAGRSVDVYNAFGEADLVVDLLGYFLPLSEAKGTTGPQGEQGPPGDPGTRILSGATDPAFAVGAVGDFYLNTATATLFGPKTTSGWISSISLSGQGAASGTGAQVWQDAGAATVVDPAGTTVAFPDGNITAYGAGPPALAGGLLTLQTAGTYRATYVYGASSPLAVSARLVHDGSAVEGSESGGASAASSVQGQALITADAGDTIALQLYGVAATVTADHASLLIEQVS